VLPALYIVATGFILVVLLVDKQQRLYSGLGLLIVLLGLPVYALWRRTAR
jgi:APA family basic amino acid/polyamine antiporter